MINKTQEVRVDKEFKDDSDYGKPVKDKSQKMLIKLKEIKNILEK